jgi:hypothetical protein
MPSDVAPPRSLLDRVTRPSTAVIVTGAGLGAMAIAVLVAALVRDDANIGDVALIELQIRDVLSADTPLVGAYSRYGWAHPGPLMFELFAVPYRVLGNDATALRLTTLLFNAAVSAALLWLLWRRGTAAVMAIGTATVLLVWGLPPGALSYGWNVTVTDLPFVLVVVGCWCALCGDRYALLVAALAASFVFQSHVGVGIVLGPAFVVAVVAVARRSMRDGFDARGWIIGVAAVALTFLPALYDTLFHWPGNLGELARWSLTNDEPAVGMADGLRMLGRVSSLSFPFEPGIPGRFLLGVATIEAGALPGLSVVLLAAAGAVAWRSGWAVERTLCALMGIVWASAVAAVASITYPLGWWLVDWFQPLGWLTWGTIALVAWRVVQRYADRGAATLATVAVLGWLGLLAGAVIAHTTDVVQADDRTAEVVRPVAELTEAAESITEPGDVVRLDAVGSALSAETMMSGVGNRLDASGRRVCVTEALAYKFGAHRVCPEEVDVHLVVRSEPGLAPPPEIDGRTSELVVAIDPLDEAERAEVDAITAEAAAILERDGRGAEVGVLDTDLAGAVLVGSPSPELLAMTDDLARLEELRRVPGIRYGLYVVGVQVVSDTT